MEIRGKEYFMPRIIFYSLFVFLMSFSLAQARNLASDDWVEYTSENFVVLSDAKPKDVRYLIEGLEHFRFVVTNLIGIQQPAGQLPFRIIAFRNTGDFRKTRKGRSVVGYFLSTLRGQYAVVDMGARMHVKKGRHDIAGRPILFHEYVHFLLRRHSSVKYPRWYEEGFADYLSTYHYEGNEVELGRPHDGRVQNLSFLNWLSGEALLGEKPGKIKGRGFEFYAQSWLLVHMLHKSPYAENLPSYLQRWSNGEHELDVFEEEFDIPVSRLKKRLQKYWVSNSYTGVTMTFDKPYVPQAPTEVKLRESDVAVRLGVFLTGQENDLAAVQFDRAIELQPDLAEAQLGLARVAVSNHEPEKARILLSEIAPLGEVKAGYLVVEGDRFLELATANYGADQGEWRRYRAAARQKYAEALNLDKDLLPAWNGLAMTCMGDEEQMEQGRNAFDELHYSVPSSATTIWLYAWHSLDMGDAATARRLLEKLTAMKLQAKMAKKAELLRLSIEKPVEKRGMRAEKVLWAYLLDHRKTHLAGEED
jgi:hypothetical protein